MKTRYILYTLLALMAILLPTSCSNDDDFLDVPVTSNGDKVTLTLGVTVPGATNVVSRAFINGDSEATGFVSDYYNFENLFVAVYEQSSLDGNYYYQGPVEVTPGAADHGCTTYNVTLTATTNPCRLHIIANYPGLNMGLDDEGEAIGRLKTAKDDLSHDVYWNFVDLPCIPSAPKNNGNSSGDNTESGSDVQTAAEGDNTGGESSEGDSQNVFDYADLVQELTCVPLVRNYAKVQLALAEGLPEDFVFKGYRVYNMPTVGTVAAYNPNATLNKFVNFVDKSYEVLAANYLGNEPHQVPLFNDEDDPNTTVVEWKSTATPTYMYERKNTNASGEQLLENAAYIIVYGKYKGADSYYKLDFVDDEGNPYNLLRNFVYTITVSAVNGPGYETEAKAMEQPAGNNLNASAAIQNFTNISNGKEQLYVSTTSMTITKYETYQEGGETKVKGIDLYFKYIPDLDNEETDNEEVVISGYQDGKVLIYTSDNTDVTPTIDYTGGTGEYAGWGKVTLIPKQLPTATQNQVLTFTAGNLQRTVTLYAQQPSTAMSVSLYPASVEMQSEQDVTVNISLPESLGNSASLFPLRMFIYSEDNTLYATSLPVEIRDGKYGFIREITLKDFQDATTVTDENENKFKVFSSAFKTNCANSATIVWVEHDYFKPASAELGNTWRSSVTLGTTIGVDIEEVYGRYPQSIYNDGDNNGTKEGVKVTYNGTELTETISINKVNVTSGMDFVSVLSRANINGTLSPDDEVVFTFTDQHWLGGNNWTPENSITYRAETTLGEIADGTTLEFKPESTQKITTITIPAGLKVEVPKDGSSNNRLYYPKNIYNEGGNDGTETVTVSFNNASETITINATSVIYDDSAEVSFTNVDGFELTARLTFTFEDQYCVGTSGSGQNRKPTWSTDRNQPLKDTYTATCTVEQLLNGTTLNFTR